MIDLRASWLRLPVLTRAVIVALAVCLSALALAHAVRACSPEAPTPTEQADTREATDQTEADRARAIEPLDSLVGSIEREATDAQEAPGTPAPTRTEPDAVQRQCRSLAARNRPLPSYCRASGAE